MAKNSQLFSISCQNCGAPVGYDIPSQSYRCTSCGQITVTKDALLAWRIPTGKDIEDAHIHAESMICSSCGATAEFDEIKHAYVCSYCGTETSLSEVRELQWKKLNTENWKKVSREEEMASCPTCGARVMFEKEDATEKCPFCGSNLVKQELFDEEELPEFILPFLLTEEEARKKLKDWAEKQKDNKDVRRVKQNLKQLKGYYLPYRMIRGPLEGRAYRDRMSRNYHYRGFLEQALVNSSSQMDNQVLDAAEPFDLSKLIPFEPGVIGGARVKLSDMSDREIRSRTAEEAREEYRPFVAKVLHNSDAEVTVDSADFMSIPILLPVYIQKIGKYLAVVNGQTGKVALAANQKPRESKRWMIEPAILTILAILVTGYFFSFYLYPMVLFGFIAGAISFTAFGQDRNRIRTRKIYQEESSSEKQRTAFKNAFPNTPVFYEHDGTREARVEMKFYSVGRVLSLMIRMAVMILLPAILAAVIHLLRSGSTSSLMELSYLSGAAWYVTTGGIAIIYWIRGVRWDVFNHPILYEILPDGKRKLFGSRKSRKLTIRSLFGVENISDIKALGKEGIAIVAFLAFLLVGSVGAILH